MSTGGMKFFFFFDAVVLGTNVDPYLSTAVTVAIVHASHVSFLSQDSSKRGLYLNKRVGLGNIFVNMYDSILY